MAQALMNVQESGECLPLTTLLDALLQKAYHDLTVLAELLPRKSDVDRKVEIVQFARQTRLLLIRLLALVKWAGNSGSVQQCTHMSGLLRNQSWLYVDTADQLVRLARNELLQACMPNFSLATALDVLSSGSYSRLPSCIRERTVPLPPLSATEQLEAFSLVECSLRRRLLQETVPDPMRVTRIRKGVVTFVVPFEFELSLSVVSDDSAVPWRLVHLKICVAEALPERPVLVHEMQKLYLHKLVQSRLFTEETPLPDCYRCLHTFCLALQMDCLHSQALRLCAEVYGGYVKVEEYVPGQHMKLAYWWPVGSPQLLPAFLLNQNIEGVGIDQGKMSIEELLEKCVAVRSRTLLQAMVESLKGSPWEERAVVRDMPLSLVVTIPVKYSCRELVLGVDRRVGHVVATVVPPTSSAMVQRNLEDLEKAVTTNKDSLPSQISTLQCQLFLALLSEHAEDLGLEVHSSLPLMTPLPIPSTSLLFVELEPLAYLTVGVAPGMVDQYYLLQLGSISRHGGGLQGFWKVASLLELDIVKLQVQQLSIIPVRQSGGRLKRKLSESCVTLPSSKRLCVWRNVSLTPLSSLLTARLSVMHIQSSLQAAGVLWYHVSSNKHGAPTVRILSFPQLTAHSSDVHTLLSSHLQSCTISPSEHSYHCRLLFSGTVGGLPRRAALQLSIPTDSDLGQALLKDWAGKCLLLELVLELQHYLEDPSWPLHSKCKITDFSYSRFTIAFWKYSLSVWYGAEGLRLEFSEDCSHSLITESLVNFLDKTFSLPLLLQGLYASEEILGVLATFVQSVAVASVVASTPAQLQLQYDGLYPHYVGMSLLGASAVELNGITNARSTLAAGVQSSTHGYFQAFLQSQLKSSTSTEPEELPLLPAQPNPLPSKPMLLPCPSPIMSPWPGSPGLPSIPPLPSPGEARLGLPRPQHPYTHSLSLEQLQTLLLGSAEEPSPMEAFLGSLNLLEKFVQQVSPQLQYSCDRGVYTFKADTISLSLSIETGSIPVLKLSLKPLQDNVWSPKELEGIVEFFQAEVACQPYSCNAMVSFVRILQLPLPTLKSFAQLMQLHMHPLADAVWKIYICLILPISPDLADWTTAFVPGSSGIVFRQKLLVFIRMVNGSSGKELVFPLMHDPKTNSTYMARQSQPKSCLHIALDSQLRKASQECPPGHHESSLYRCMKAVSLAPLT